MGLVIRNITLMFEGDFKMKNNLNGMWATFTVLNIFLFGRSLTHYLSDPKDYNLVSTILLGLILLLGISLWIYFYKESKRKSKRS